MENEDTKQEKFISFFKKWSWLFGAVAGLLSILSLLGTVVTLVTKVDGEKIKTAIHLWDYFNLTYSMNWSMWITLGLIVIGIALAIASKWKKDLATGASLSYLVSACLLILTREFFSNNTIENYKDTQIGYGSALAIIFVIIGAVFALISDYSKQEFNVRDMAEDGVLIALAFGLNFVKIPLGATGGSINFQMLPLMLIALRHGPVHGLISGGLIFGLLTCLTDGYGFATYPFDYLIGFGSVAVMGFFSEIILPEGQKGYTVKGELFLLLAGVLSTFVRFVGSVTSSMVVYGYEFVPALEYNALYIPLSGAAALIVIMACYGPLCQINSLFPARK